MKEEKPEEEEEEDLKSLKSRAPPSNQHVAPLPSPPKSFAIPAVPRPWAEPAGGSSGREGGEEWSSDPLPDFAADPPPAVRSHFISRRHRASGQWAGRTTRHGAAPHGHPAPSAARLKGQCQPESTSGCGLPVIAPCSPVSPPELRAKDSSGPISAPIPNCTPFGHPFSAGVRTPKTRYQEQLPVWEEIAPPPQTQKAGHMTAERTGQASPGPVPNRWARSCLGEEAEF
ncbi:protein transport protein sec31-like [Sarcophilus harrisii]|uniref:protein transport protein sec31-like n=1 Tax=Sarcophilus harrisii TaxID=9305 RepID=UPI001301EF39|nr:protein transport protein sec31-like [Sarcophilus harrisii]